MTPQTPCARVHVLLAGALVGLLLLLRAVPQIGAEQLIFDENFNTLDEGRWSHQVSAWRGGNNEFQYYRNDRRNSYVRDGILYVKPTFTADEYGEEFMKNGKLQYPGCDMEPCVSEAGADIVLPIQSARMSTKGKFSFRYGRMEVRAKMPKGDWIWPAIWLMPEEDKYGGWPRSGEIDVVETRGNENLRVSPGGDHKGIRNVESTLHFGPAWDADAYGAAHGEKMMPNSTLADSFHVYVMDWSENGFRFTVDGEQVAHMPAPAEGFWKLGKFSGEDIWGGERMAPFNQKFYLILNVAVGGNFFPDGWHNEPNPRPWDYSSGHPLKDFWEKRDWWKGTWQGENAAMQIDYIKIYQN